MGKKYNAGVKIAPVTELEAALAFGFVAYEGIKPSRAKAIKQGNKALAMVEQDDRKDRPSNHKPKTDKRGRRPVVEKGTVMIPHMVSLPYEMVDYPYVRAEWMINVNQDWKVLGTIKVPTGAFTLLEGSEGAFLIRKAARNTRLFGFRQWSDVVESFASLMYEWGIKFTEALGLDPDLYPDRTGEWGLVLQDGNVVHEDGYIPAMGRVIGTMKGMWGKSEKYIHLPKFEYDRETGKARI